MVFQFLQDLIFQRGDFFIIRVFFGQKFEEFLGVCFCCKGRKCRRQAKAAGQQNCKVLFHKLVHLLYKTVKIIGILHGGS